MVFEVLGKPQGKGRVRFRQNGHPYTPKVTALYEKAVTRAFLQAKGVILEGEVRAVITAYYPIPKSTSKKKKDEMLSGMVRPTKKPDCDNIAKIILDALNKVAYKDDSQVVELVVNKRYGEVAKVVVELEKAEANWNKVTLGDMKKEHQLISIDLLEQILWERDLIMERLEELHYGFTEMPNLEEVILKIIQEVKSE